MLIKQRKTHHWTTILTNGNAQFSIPYLLSVVNLGGMGLMARARTFRLERQVEAARFSGRRRTSGGSPVTATKWRAGGGAASLPVSTSSTLIKQFNYEKCREGGGAVPPLRYQPHQPILFACILLKKLNNIHNFVHWGKNFGSENGVRLSQQLSRGPSSKSIFQTIANGL